MQAGPDITTLLRIVSGNGDVRPHPVIHNRPTRLGQSVMVENAEHGVGDGFGLNVTLKMEPEATTSGSLAPFGVTE